MTIIPPISATAPNAPTQPTGQQGAVLTQLPAALPSTPGMIITGTIVGRDSQGQMLLQTDAGMVSFKTAAVLSVGSQVSLQIQTVGSQMQAVILSALAGSKPATSPTTANRPSTAAGTTAAAPATTIASSVSTGSVLTATVIGSAGTPIPATPPGGPPAALQAPTGNATNAPVQGSVPAARPTPGSTSPTSSPISAANLPATPGVPSSPSGNPSTPAALVAQQDTTPTAAAVSTAASRYAATPGTVTAPVTALPAGSAPAAGPAPSIPTTTSQAPNTQPSGTPGSQTSLLQATVGTTVQVRLAGALQGAPPSASAMAVTATVVAHAASGQTVIDTPIGRLSVSLPAGAGHRPPGSTIALEIISFSSGAAAAGTPPVPGSGTKSMPALSNDWPTLKAAISALTSVDPSFARQLVDIALPRFGTPRFLSQLLGQLVSGGGPMDARTLLGDTAHALLERAGRGDVLARLDTELHEMNRLNSSSSDWRVIFLPIADLNELRQLRVYTRKKKDKGKGKERSGRFIVEADFEAYGPLQLDGLVQKPRIDLIVRSHVEFTPSMQAGIAEVFGRTCDASGLIGKIFFHTAPNFPVSPLDEMAQAGPGLSV